MIYKYREIHNDKHIANFKNNQLLFNYIYKFDDRNELDIKFTDDLCSDDMRGTGLDLSPLLKEERAFIIRVCSLCRSSTSDYMWKEYAADGEGFCLGYELEDILNADKNIICGDVFYDDNTPELGENSSPEEVFKKQIYHKLTKFKNEEEIRLVYIFPSILIEEIDINQKEDEDKVSIIPTPRSLMQHMQPCKKILPKLKFISVTPKIMIIGRKCNEIQRNKLIEIAKINKIAIKEQGDAIE